MGQRKLSNRSPEAVASGLRAAEIVCQERQIKLTRNRQMVLECLWHSERPMKAYEILRVLQRGLGRPLAPPTVYRALEFLLEHGLVPRIETTSSFAPSVDAGHKQPGVLFVCASCGFLSEVKKANLREMFESDAAPLGFRVETQTIELQGTCAGCLSDERATA